MTDGRFDTFPYRDPRLGPTVAALVVVGVVVLNFGDLATGYRNHLLTGLVVYTLGTAIIGFMHVTVAGGQGSRPWKPWRFAMFAALHIALLAVLARYLYWRGAL